MVRLMRFLSKNDAVISLDKTGEIECIEVPVLQTPETEILFNSKYYDWRYNGKDTLANGSTIDPRGEHFFEELDGSDHGYTENYQSVGHCPYGRSGDAIFFDGKVLDITGVDIHEKYKSGCVVGWKWVVFTDKKSAESEADIAERYYNTSR